MNDGANDDPANLELSAAQMQSMGEAVLARSVAHLAALDESPACGDFTGIEALCRSMRESAPEQGASLESLLDPLFDEWIPRSFGTPAPGYLAYIPGGGIYTAALADFIADTTNRYTGIWQAAPALVQLEANALDWLRDWMQFPSTARGLFTTGGSMARGRVARGSNIGPCVPGTALGWTNGAFTRCTGACPGKFSRTLRMCLLIDLNRK